MKRMGCGSVVALGGVLGWGGGGAEVKGGGGKMPGGTTGNVMPGGVAVKPEAADAFTTAVNEFKRHDEARDWDDASCKKVSDEFLAAGKAQGGKFPAAHYNAGITILKCSKESDAPPEFEIGL